jgi:hypothetical protein
VAGSFFDIQVAEERTRQRLAQVQEGIFSQVMMKEIGEYMKTRIKVRTQQGKDVNERRFAPYTPAYKIFREQAGRATNIVNLTFTGSMLSAIQYEAKEKEVRLFFANTSDERGGRNPVKAFGLQQKRRFFGISEADRQGIMEIVQRYARRATRGG